MHKLYFDTKLQVIISSPAPSPWLESSRGPWSPLCRGLEVTNTYTHRNLYVSSGIVISPSHTALS